MKLNYLNRSNMISADVKLDIIYRVARDISFNKATAAKFVGGRRRLDKLIAECKIRAIRTGDMAMSPYQVNASDVLMYAVDRKSQRI